MYITEQGRLEGKNLPYEEMLKETAESVGGEAFLTRVEKIRGKGMRFKDKRHKNLFIAASKDKNRKDNKLMSAIYLLTADIKLWRKSKPYVSESFIAINQIPLDVGSEERYTLLCCAKDLLWGTQYVTADDLANRNIISPKIFRLVCTAMTIRRYGMEILRFDMEEGR